MRIVQVWLLLATCALAGAQKQVKDDDGSGLHVLFKTNWSIPVIHYTTDNGAKWQHKKMDANNPKDATFARQDGWFQFDVNASQPLNFAFADGNGLWERQQDGKNFTVPSNGTFAIESTQGQRGAQEYVKGPGYEVTGVQESGNKLVLALKLLKASEKTPYGDDIQELEVQISQQDEQMVHVKIVDKHSKRWEVPKPLYERGLLGREDKSDKQQIKQAKQKANNKYEFKYTKSPFAFQVIRKEDKYVLFDSSALALVLKDQYLQIATSVPKDLNVYGIGETTRDSMRMAKGEKHTLWARDQAAADDNQNLYGSHPFYIGLNSEGKAHGVFLLNSNGMDVTLEEDKLVYQVLGGVLDFYVLTGANPSAIVSKYTSLIGRPKLLPYWSFGFHQCRWGYRSLDMLKFVVDNYAKHKIPLDVMWADIDYMEDYYDFTVGKKNFTVEGMKSFVDGLHGKGQHFVPIIDPGIPDDSKDPTYTRGLELDVYIKDSEGKPYLGQVWPGPTVFPDFFHPNATGYWKENLDRLYGMIQYDGIWIDMNELANFCPGTTCQRDPGAVCPVKTSLDTWTTCCLVCKDDMNKYNHPPFQINNGNSRDALFNKGISTSAVQYGGIKQYDTHNLYGFTEAIATDKAIQQIQKKRGFVLSRSTFAGSGAYTAHWTGDNKSTWNDLRWSIVTILNLGLFGVPMVGADICGFFEDTTEELCGRWTALGAFYPFSRNHNGWNFKPQETYVWDSVAQVGRKFLGMRYQLLPYLYSLGYHAHTTGVPIARPMFMEFPKDSNCAVSPAVDRQFFLGRSILVTPVLEQGATSVEGYMPKGVWYNLFDHSMVQSKGEKMKFDAANITDMPVHIRGGSILVMHQEGMLTSTEARSKPFDVVLALAKTENQTIKSNLFLDDGDEISIGEHASEIEFVAKANAKGIGSMTWTPKKIKYAEATTMTVRRVVVLGVEAKPSNVECGGTQVAGDKVDFNEKLQQLTINLPASGGNGTAAALGQSYQIAWK